MYCYTHCPQPCSRPPPTHASTGDSWPLPGKSGSVSCGITAPFSWVLVHTKLCLCLRVCFPVLCKFWQLYGGVSGDLLQEGLCHTQVCTQSPCRCSSPLLTCTSTGDAQTQCCLTVCGVPGSWGTQGLFEPSERLWRVWGLILNANLPFLLSCWGFPFALRSGISPHSCSSDEQPPLQRLPSCWGFSDLGHGVSPHAAPAKCCHSSWPWTWGICSRPLQWSTVAIPDLGHVVWGNVKEYSNYHTISFISHAIRVMLRILQARLQQ